MHLENANNRVNGEAICQTFKMDDEGDKLLHSMKSKYVCISFIRIKDIGLRLSRLKLILT